MEYSLSNSLVGGGGGLNLDKLSLDLPFAITKSLTAAKGPTPDFVRASSGTYFGSDGYLKTAGNNIARFDHETSYIGSYVKVICEACITENSGYVPESTIVPFTGIDINGYPTFDNFEWSIIHDISSDQWQATYFGGAFQAISNIGYGVTGGYAITAGQGDDCSVLLELACKGLLIEEQSTNLLKYSEDYTQSDWVKLASSVSTSPAVSPTGGSCKRITMNAGSSQYPLYGTLFATVTSRVVTLSAYVKYANAQWIWVRGMTGDNSTTSSCWAAFDIQNKVIGGKLSNVTSHKITNVGNGWCRIEMTYTEIAVLSNVNIVFRVGNASTPTDSNTTQAGTEQFDLWGAQLEAKAFPTSYIPTTTGSASRSADLCSITGAKFLSFYNQPAGTIIVDAYSQQSDVGRFTSMGPVTDRTCEIFNNDSASRIIALDGTNNLTLSSLSTFPSKFGLATSTNDSQGVFKGVLSTSSTSLVLKSPTFLYIGYYIGNSNWLNGCISSIKYYKKRLPNAKLQSLTAP